MYRNCKRRHDAEDWTQEAYLAAIKSGKAITGSGWLVVAGRNAWLTALRKRKIATVPLTTQDRATEPKEPFTGYLPPEVEMAVLRLPPTPRRIVLGKLAGYSYEQICRLLNISGVAYARLLYHRALVALKSEFCLTTGKV